MRKRVYQSIICLTIYGAATVACAGSGPQTATALDALCEAAKLPAPKELDKRDREALLAVRVACAARDAYGDGGVQ